MKIGFVGLGNMGGPMCRNMMKGVNHQVVVHDLNPEAVRACTEAGATAAESLGGAGGQLRPHLHLPADAEGGRGGGGRHRAQHPPGARRCSTSAPMRRRW